MAMDSGSKTGATLLAVGMAAVLYLMYRVRAYPKYELVLLLFLIGQIVNLVLIVRDARKGE